LVAGLIQEVGGLWVHAYRDKKLSRSLCVFRAPFTVLNMSES
jgi:hypothetical protein